MTDVLLIKLESAARRGGFAPPFGILYLGDALEKAGFKVRLLHEPGTGSAIRKLTGEIAREKPIFVGFSSFTSSSLVPTVRAAIEIKRRFKLPVVWGGIHPTILPEQTLENEFVDIVGIGEGEETIVELAEFLASRGFDPAGLASIPGIGFRERGRAVITPPRPFIDNLDAYSPAWHLLGIERYIFSREHFYTQIGSRLSGERIGAVITSRGCPWRCSYCYNNTVNRRRFRAQSVEKVARDVEYLKRYGVSTIIFEDDNLFADPERARKIVRGLKVNWSSTIRADCVAGGGEDFIRELSENGCLELRIGAESGSRETLNTMKKDLSVEQIRTAVALCSRFKIKSLLNFMIGIPGESWDDVCRTLDLMDELQESSRYVTVGAPAVYVPFPGTALYQEALRSGYVPPKTLEEWGKDFGHSWKLAPYADKRIRYIGFYSSLIRREFDTVSFSLPAKWLRRLALSRWKRRFFSFPADYHLPAACLRALRKAGLKSLSRALYE